MDPNQREEPESKSFPSCRSYVEQCFEPALLEESEKPPKEAAMFSSTRFGINRECSLSRCCWIQRDESVVTHLTIVLSVIEKLQKSAVSSKAAASI